MLKTRLGAVVAAVLLSLTACSSLDIGRAGRAPDGTPIPDTHGNHQGHASHPHTVEAGPPPHGFRVLHAPRAGFQFAAPADWVLVEADKVADAGADALEDYADSIGISPEQLTALMRQVELFAVNASGDNINVLPMGVLAEVPNNATIRTQLKAVGADIERIVPAEVPVGPGRVAYYSIKYPSQPLKYGAGLFVRTPRGIASLTVTTSSRIGTRHLLQQVLPTVQPIGSAGQA